MKTGVRGRTALGKGESSNMGGKLFPRVSQEHSRTKPTVVDVVVALDDVMVGEG